MKILRTLLNVGSVTSKRSLSYYWYRGSAHRDCNINLKLNHKIPIVFHNLKNYDSDLIIVKLAKFNLKINVTPNGLEKYMSFTINNNNNINNNLS